MLRLSTLRRIRAKLFLMTAWIRECSGQCSVNVKILHCSGFLGTCAVWSLRPRVVDLIVLKMQRVDTIFSSNYLPLSTKAMFAPKEEAADRQSYTPPNKSRQTLNICFAARIERMWDTVTFYQEFQNRQNRHKPRIIIVEYTGATTFF